MTSKTFLNATVVKDGQSDRGFPDPPCTDESDRGEVFCEADDLLNQLVAPETGPRRWGWGLSRCTRLKYKALGTLVV